MTPEELRAQLAAVYVKSWIDCARQYCAVLEKHLSVDEQAAFWGYFDSRERRFLIDPDNGTTRKRQKEL